ncbi:MAG: efflux RND transporter permease subunit, partial [Candidatus Omnitrophica bacterium]|nr:efflux RND transporter permease subunit [Candidatus Omnitrophota bacterium]
MRNIFEFFIRRHLIANLLTVMVFLLGLNTLLTIQRDNYPHVDLDHMLITTVYPGASPEDVEINVTNKIEKELKSISGIKDILSVSMENTSSIRVVIDEEVRDVEKVKLNVREAVNRVVDFPQEVKDAPLIEEVTTSLLPVIEVGVWGDVPYKDLREYARRLEKKLKNISQVSRLDTFGLRAREIQIEVSPDQVRDYQISLGEIITAIRNRNIRLTAGTMESFTTEQNIVTMSEFDDPMEVGDVIVRTTFEGPSVKVKDLALIRDDFEKASTFTRLNGHNAISFVVFKKETADVIRTADAVKALVDEIKDFTPEGVHIDTAADFSHYVKNRFKVVLANALMGLIFVLVLLRFFLNWRASFWVGVGIPVSLLGTIFLMPYFGAYLDCLTLSAMIMVMGIVVDDAIIIGENIFTHRQMGKEPVQAAVDGITQVYKPVLTTIFTTFFAFAPMFFMEGIFGKFVFVMPLVISLALIISMFESMIALPAHLLPGLKYVKDISSRKNWFNHIEDKFQKSLQLVLKGRYVIVPLFIFVFIFSLWFAHRYMRFVLFPAKMAEEIYISVELPKGTTLERTTEKVKKIEGLVKEISKEALSSYVSRVGEDFYYEIANENHAYLIISLTPYSERHITAQEIVDRLREKTDQLPGYTQILYYIETGGPPVGKPINLYVIGDDDGMRKTLADQVVQFLEGMEGVKDLERSDKLGKIQVELKPKYEKLARFGLTVADIAQNARVAFDGEVVTSVRYHDEDVDFRVINNQESRQDPDYLPKLLIPNNEGRMITMDKVIDLKPRPGLAYYQHYDHERAVIIFADVDKEKVSPLEVVDQVMQKFHLERDWPGMRIVKGGETFETEKSIASLTRAFIIAIIGIYFLLIMLFNS